VFSSLDCYDYLIVLNKILFILLFVYQPFIQIFELKYYNGSVSIMNYLNTELLKIRVLDIKINLI